ncbi:MAG: aquaporin family protein [Planctomycetales bacterium]|nr:aquaporin family protein [Planctomycetales bacterium]
MKEMVAEFLGTALLVLMGNGVVANVLLKQTKGHDAGLIVITTGWGLSVFTAVVCFGEISGAHLNPAVTVGLAAAGEFAGELVVGYIMAQLAGAIFGAAVAYAFYSQHYAVTDDAATKLGTFCTAPSIRGWASNLFSEAIGTFVLVFSVLRFSDPTLSMSEGTTTPIGLGSVGAIRVGLIVFAIGLCLGGTTGYAINPARDLGPRIAHAILPIPNKGGSDWSYAPIPVLGPILGGLFAAAVNSILKII